MRLISWLLRAFIFFTLFAFALNNQQTASVRWFFGVQWQAPMVMVVLAAFAAGCAVGVLAMVPSWWRQRRVAQLAAPDTRVQASVAPSSLVPSTFGAEAGVPPREGL